MFGTHCLNLWYRYPHHLLIYTTKIDGVVCPPNISETVAGRLMKLAHRPRIASTMIKLISKSIVLPIYTTKIDGVVCPPNISETVAVRTVKLAHRPRIASTTITFISKPILLSI